MSKNKAYYSFNCDKIDDSTQISETEFYQFCTHEHPDTKKYYMRKFEVSSSNEFTSVKRYRLTEKKLKEMLKDTPQHKYTLHSTFDFKDIEYPGMAEITLSRSDILDNKSEYTGYAKF